jgi:glycosyltransferase involved in cell wall biosynthesis
MADAEGRLLCVQLLPETQDAGAENQARYLLHALAAQGRFDLELAYFGAGRGHPAFEAIGTPMRCIERRHRFRLDLPGRTRRIRRAYANRHPDVLQTWLLEGNIFGLLAARAWPRTALVISNRGSWNELGYPLHARLQRLLIGRADHAISNSPGGADALAEMGMDRQRISIIPNGIPEERVRVREERDSVRTARGWRGPVVAWVGRSNDPAAMEQKDFAGMLVAMARVVEEVPDARLALVGLSRADVAEAGFDLPAWVDALGVTDRAPDLLNAADVVAISSRAEGHSNVAGEALMLGLPVVTTNCGGHADLVAAAGGRVVAVGDASALAASILALLARPPDRDLVRGAARPELSVDRLAERTAAVYERVVAEKRGRYRGAPCAE